MKPIENLFENYKNIKSKVDDDGRVIIDVDDPLVSETTSQDYDEPEAIIPDDVILPPSLRFNKQAMHISIKSRTDSSDQSTTFGPNMSVDSSYQDGSDDGEISEIVCMPSMDEFGGLPEGMDDLEDMDDDVMICNEFLVDDVDASNFEQTPLVQYSQQNHELMNRQAMVRYNPPDTIRTYSRVSPLAPKPVQNNGHRPMKTENQLIPALYLRNPRGNTSRNYTQEELFMALNAIKEGLSIYRASQQYKVPRKTLRNWMKRWQIKSAFPMPAQLRRAAEKRKEHQDQMYQAHSMAPVASFSLAALKTEQNQVDHQLFQGHNITPVASFSLAALKTESNDQMMSNTIAL